MINSRDAEKTGIKGNEKYQVKLNGQTVQLRIKVDNQLPPGIAGNICRPSENALFGVANEREVRHNQHQ